MKFSVLMSVYAGDCVEHLFQCLESLTEQSTCANEVVLVEDGFISSELENVINDFRIRLNIKSIKLKYNSGLAVALNEGLKHCSYDLVARMDSDDVALPDRFKEQINVFANKPHLDILGGFAQEFNTLSDFGRLRVMPIMHDDIVANLFVCPLIHPTIMYRKKGILRAGGYNSDLTRRQDYDLWFRCAKIGLKFENIARTLILYRFSNLTHRKQSKRILWQQGIIGFGGCRDLKQPIWKGVIAFFPLARSFFPGYLEHMFYNLAKKFDPRQREQK